MSKRYQIWNKIDDVYTPGGKKYSAEEWANKYEWTKLPESVPVLSAGMINGGRIEELFRMKNYAEQQGATFEEGLDNQQLLDAIEAWEDEQAAKAAEEAAVRAAEPTAEERIAAAMEYQNLLSL